MTGIGNDRLWNAVQALATHTGDVRSRVIAAMRIIGAMHPNELDRFEGLTNRIIKIRQETSLNGALILNGSTVRDAYENTAVHRHNKAYVKHAEEIFSIWMATCNE